MNLINSEQTDFRYAGIDKFDVNNGNGVGVTLFVQGCSHHCKGCHNQSTWNTYEAIIQNPTYLKILELCNVLVDGEFKIEEKDLRLQFRGSKNQRIIDVQKSINDNRTVLWNKKG